MIKRIKNLAKKGIEVRLRIKKIFDPIVQTHYMAIQLNFHGNFKR